MPARFRAVTDAGAVPPHPAPSPPPASLLRPRGPALPSPATGARVAPSDPEHLRADVDAVHDLLLTLTGDPGVAASATVDVALRTGARYRDGATDRADRQALLTAATRHGIALAGAGRLDRSATQVGDLAAVTLVSRHHWSVGDTAAATGLPRGRVRSLPPHGPALPHDRGAGSQRAPARPRDDHADGAPVAAPDEVRALAARALHGTGGRTPDRSTRPAVTAAATLGLLVAIALGTPRVAELATAGDADAVTGQQVEFDPTPASGHGARDRAGPAPVGTTAGPDAARPGDAAHAG